MNTSSLRPALLLALAATTLAACQKESDDATPTTTATVQAKTVSNLATVGTTSSTGAPVSPRHYTFFSLADGKEVAYPDSNSTKWDFAVNRTVIIFNGGSGGPGQGGAQLQDGLFSSLATAPTTGYNVDSPTARAITASSDKGWYNYSSSTNVVTPLAGKVLLIRTATGKYAKMEIQSYYKDAPASPTSANASGYYTFRYVYQPSGTSFN